MGSVSCGGDTPDRRATPDVPSAGEPTAGAVTPDPVADPGVIRGSVVFSGTPPTPRTLQVSDHTEICGETRLEGALLLGDDGGVPSAVVSLVDIEGGAPFAVPDRTVDLDQRECDFVPHVVLAGVDQQVVVHNSDPLTHNVHTLTFDSRPTNRSQPAGAAPVELRFGVAERVKVQCDLHPWMSAWIVVIDHPYHAVTGDNGSFILSDVPPGTYTVEIWHEALGTRQESVTVTPHDTTDLRIVLTTRD